MNERQAADIDPILEGAGTIDLQEEGSRGVLLLHGFGDTPQTLALLARSLHSSGYSVLAPLMPGHGRSMAAFTESNADQWLDAARRALIGMRSTHDSVAVVGLSMGGALSVILAVEVHAIQALVLIAPYIVMPWRLQLAAATHRLWGGVAGEVNARNPLSIHDPIEREKNLAYGVVTGRMLHELWKLMRRARRSLSAVRAPALIIQSREDPRLAPKAAKYTLRNLGSREKRLVWMEGAGHIITVDYGRERVFGEVRGWLEMHTRHGATAAPDIRAAVERPEA